MPRAALARKPLPKPNPESDPRFRKVMDQLKAGAAKTKSHPPAAKKAADAAAAAKGPPNERVAGGKAKQVDKIKEAKEGKPEQSSFLAVLRAEIAKAMPKNLGATEKFDQTANQMKGGLKGNVGEQKEKSTKDVSGASKQAPAASGDAKVEKPLPPEGAPGAPSVNASEGMPAPKSDADVSLQDSKQDVDGQMQEAEVSTPQLQKANDPRFSAVLTAKTQVAQNADAGPAKYRAAEASTLGAAAATATAATRAGAAAMVGVRSGGNVRVLTRQQQQRARDEAKRKEVVDKIEAIYNATKTRVEAKLNALDGEVNGIFDRGVDAAVTTMTNFVNARLRDYKIRRYLSIPLVGLARWVRDQFLDLPSEVNVFYEEGRALFQGLMDALVVRVANLVEQRLKEAKAEVAKGQADIKAFVASQPRELQQVAQDAQRSVASRFEELEKGIEDKKNQLATALAQKYKEGFDKANEALKKIQDENKGLVAAFAEKLGEIIKMLREFKEKLMSIIRKGEDTIKLILNDPIGFLGNLINAVKGGINAFVGNIKKHLIAGFNKWLFGNLPPGIEIPTELSLPSILKLVLQVLGITYDRMRAKAVRLIGERNVRIIEKVVEYLRVLITGGPAALWEKVKEDLSSLKDMVIEAIKNWLIETVIKQAVTKIVSMFNPVGAIIQAIIGIYNLVMFVVEKAQQIMTFIESVVNSINAIATGAIGAAVARVEQALADAVPIVIGFLARLLGLSGITQKIRDFITKVQAKVDGAIDKAIDKIVGVIKRTIGRILGGDRRAAADAGDQQDQQTAALATPLPPVKVPFSLPGQSHSIEIKPEGRRVKVTMASVAAPIEQKYSAAHERLDNWKRYIASIADGKARARFEAEWLPKIDALVAIQTGNYQALYDRFYDQWAQRVENARRQTGNPQAQPRSQEGQTPPPQAPASQFVKEATTQIQALIASVRAWAVRMRIGDLSAQEIDTVVDREGPKIWEAEWRARQREVTAIFARHQSRVPFGATLAYRGSLLRGARGPHKGRIRFNPDSFDVDAFVISTQLHGQALAAGGRPRFGRQTAAINASDSGVPSMVNLRSAVAADLSQVEGFQSAADFDIHIRRG